MLFDEAVSVSPEIPSRKEKPESVPNYFVVSRGNGHNFLIARVLLVDSMLRANNAWLAFKQCCDVLGLLLVQKLLAATF